MMLLTSSLVPSLLDLFNVHENACVEKIGETGYEASSLALLHLLSVYSHLTNMTIIILVYIHQWSVHAHIKCIVHCQFLFPSILIL